MDYSKLSPKQLEDIISEAKKHIEIKKREAKKAKKVPKEVIFESNGIQLVMNKPKPKQKKGEFTKFKKVFNNNDLVGIAKLKLTKDQYTEYVDRVMKEKKNEFDKINETVEQYKKEIKPQPKKTQFEFKNLLNFGIQQKIKIGRAHV